MLLMPGGGRCAVTKGDRNRSDASCLWGYKHVVSFRGLKKICEGVDPLFRSLLNGGSLVHLQGDWVTKIAFVGVQKELEN